MRTGGMFVECRKIGRKNIAFMGLFVLHLRGNNKRRPMWKDGRFYSHPNSAALTLLEKREN